VRQAVRQALQLIGTKEGRRGHKEAFCHTGGGRYCLRAACVGWLPADARA